ncbi:MAG: nucleotide exchange factor GrpE [Candidatus Micrarchaeaceae archaeon]
MAGENNNNTEKDKQKDNDKRVQQPQAEAEAEAKAAEQQKQQKQQQQQKQQENGQNNEVAELKDRLLRFAAEFDNYKKKAANDIQHAKDLGKAELIAKLLPAIDAFEIALYSMNNNQDELNKGFGLVFTDLYETLKSEGLQEVNIKSKFDPYTQEAVLTKPSEKEEGSVLEVVRKGYTFNSILIRPASVIVSNGKKP